MFFVKGNLQEAYWLKYCWLIHAVKRRQHSIWRDVDLYVAIECLKKKCRHFMIAASNHNRRDLQIILKLLSSRQHE